MFALIAEIRGVRTIPQLFAILSVAMIVGKWRVRFVCLVKYFVITWSYLFFLRRFFLALTIMKEQMWRVERQGSGCG